MEKRKNGFTLIELIAVLVILAILAIIVTPIVLNIVKKAKDIANKRSVDAYGKTVELSVATYMLDNGEYPTCQSDLKIEYSGNEVNCNIMNLNENGSVYLSECTVGGKEVKDSKTDDGWYHYGKESMLTEKYQEYKIGDQVTYNGMNFYVIANSDDMQDSVTLLKAEPLTYDEVNIYGAGHINRYVPSWSDIKSGQLENKNGYGALYYYSNVNCVYDPNSKYYSGCSTDYETSDIKYVVDAWANSTLDDSELSIDENNYKVRLITMNELLNNLGYSNSVLDGTGYKLIPEYTPEFVYNSNYSYWTMSSFEDSNYNIFTVEESGWLSYYPVCGLSNPTQRFHTVRPVINLYKTSIDNSNSQKVSNAIDLKCS